MDKKIEEEYDNYINITKKFENISFLDDEKRRKIFDDLQMLLEDRILYRWKHKKKPYNGYNIIEDEEYQFINHFFNDHLEYIFNKYMKYAISYNTEQHKDMSRFYNDLMKKFDDIIKIRTYFIDTINNKDKNKENSNLSNEIKVSDNYVEYKNIRIKLDTRLKFLLQKGKKKFMRMILRYLGYGITGQHCALPTNVYKYLYDNFGIRGEGFCSPLNSKLIEMKDTVFCTLFKDTDKYYGSKGPFSSKTLIKNQHVNWTANSPYIPNVMMITYKEIKKAFKKITRNDFLIIVLFPKWENDKAYNKFKNYKYLVKLIEPDVGKHYMNCNGRVTYMKQPINSMFFISKDKNVVSDEKINKLLETWNTYEQDLTNQSFFTKPEFIK